MPPRARQRRDIGTPIDRNLALELVRVTEGAAIAASRFMGRDLLDEPEQAAVDAMRRSLSYVDMDGVVVIGEGEKDDNPMLYSGETVGNGNPPKVDVAVDPIDSARLVAGGLPGGLSTVALAERGSLFHTHCYYMEKLIVGPRARKVIDITDTVAANLKRIARAEGRDVEDLTVVVLNRPRHQRLLREIRDAGARVKLIPDGDISAGLWAAMEQRTGIDVLWGIGGAPEGVLAACAVKAVGGGMQGRLAPRDEGERAIMRSEGKDTSVLTLDDLCAGENVFFAATGVTEGHLLQGVRIAGRGLVSTNSVVMRSYSGTVRYIEATHDIARLQARAPIAPAGGGL